MTLKDAMKDYDIKALYSSSGNELDALKVLTKHNADEINGKVQIKTKKHDSIVRRYTYNWLGMVKDVKPLYTSYDSYFVFIVESYGK